jgi:hypothetical protein
MGVGGDFWKFVNREAVDEPRKDITGAHLSRKAQVRGPPVKRLQEVARPTTS